MRQEAKNMNKETNDNNNSTYLQSTKAYRTKACLLGVLLAFTFVIREFFIYNIQLGFAEYNGVDRHSFIDWLAVYRNYDGMFFLGLLIFLIPYEWIAERLKSKMDRVTEKTVHAKKPILFVAMLAMLLIMGLTALCVRSSYQWAFVICGVGISFLICLKAGKLFETETSWLLYAAIYNVLGYILFLLIARYEAENGNNRISTLMCLNETEEEVLVVLLAMGAALFFGVISASDKNRTVKKVVTDLVSAVLAPGVLLYGLFRILGKVDDDVRARAKLHADIPENTRLGSGMTSFGKPLFLAVLALLVVIIILMAMSCRLVSKRSKQRAVIVCWCMIIAIAFLIVDILSHLGVITQLMNDSISFDGALVMLMFIVIRSFAGCDKPQR
jgi:hypothetical protein